MRILREADACKAAGELGALLRREGLYSSHLVLWRRQREAGALAGMRAKKRGPKAKVADPRVKQLEKENARLQRQLKQAETIIDIQKNSRVRRRPYHLVDQKLSARLPSRWILGGVAVYLLVTLRTRKKTWSGGACALAIGDAVRRSRLGK
jgi:transposase-like protein